MPRVSDFRVFTLVELGLGFRIALVGRDNLGTMAVKTFRVSDLAGVTKLRNEALLESILMSYKQLLK